MAECSHARTKEHSARQKRRRSIFSCMRASAVFSHAIPFPPRLFAEKKNDDFVKSPSVPLGAGLRCNFVVAAPKGPHSSVFAPLASGAFYEFIKIGDDLFSL